MQKVCYPFRYILLKFSLPLKMLSYISDFLHNENWKNSNIFSFFTSRTMHCKIFNKSFWLASLIYNCIGIYMLGLYTGKAKS